MVVNFGPQADGDFRPEEKALATAIGKWMSRYGKAVYACDYAGFDKQDWGYYTRGKNGEVYMVDGGLEYLRRSYNENFPAEELSVYLEDGHEVVREVATWGSYGKNGDEPLKYILIKDMTEEHIQN